MRLKQIYPEYVDIYGSPVNYFSTIHYHRVSFVKTFLTIPMIPNEPTLQFDPGLGQGHHIIMNFIMCGVTA